MISFLERLRALVGGGGRHCPRCGAEVSESARVCFMCGAGLPPRRRRKELKTRIAAAGGRSGRICPHCGASVSQRARVCSVCERPLRKERKPTVAPLIAIAGARSVRKKRRARCPACGARIGEGADVCPMCGAELGRVALERAVAEVASSPPLSTPTGTRRPRRRCPQCGAPVAATARRCTLCGAEIVEQPPVPPAPKLRFIRGRAIWAMVAVAVILLLASGARAYWGSRPTRTPTPTCTPLPRRPTSTATPTATLTPTSTSTPTVTPTSTSTPTPTFTPTPTLTPTPIVHVVQPGETLYSIARRYEVSVGALCAANGIPTNHILHPNDELIIPADSSVLTPTPLPAQVIHVVQAGERLGDIARRYGVSEESIRTANDLEKGSRLRPGERLVVPLKPTATPTFTATPTATPTPGPPYQAPHLLYPPDGAVVGHDVPVILQWTSVGILQADEWYAIRLRYLGRRDELIAYTRVTSWRIPDNWYPGKDARERRFVWSVQVVRKEPMQVLSAPGEERTFKWQ